MDLERVEKLLSLFERSRAQELRVEADGWRIAVRRGLPCGPAPVAPAPDLELTIGEADSLGAPTFTVTAPLVGIFRAAGERLAPGDRVRAGGAIGAIESMKILSPVVSQTGGLIEDVLVEDGHPVEYGEPLFLLRPLDGAEEEEGE